MFMPAKSPGMPDDGCAGAGYAAASGCGAGFGAVDPVMFIPENKSTGW